MKSTRVNAELQLLGLAAESSTGLRLNRAVFRVLSWMIVRFLCTGRDRTHSLQSVSSRRLHRRCDVQVLGVRLYLTGDAAITRLE